MSEAYDNMIAVMDIKICEIPVGSARSLGRENVVKKIARLEENTFLMETRIVEEKIFLNSKTFNLSEILWFERYERVEKGLYLLYEKNKRSFYNFNKHGSIGFDDYEEIYGLYLLHEGNYLNFYNPQTGDFTGWFLKVKRLCKGLLLLIGENEEKTFDSNNFKFIS